MIRPTDIRINAAHPELPLAEAVTFTGSPSTVLIRGVPPNCGRWAITAVFVAASFPDGSTTTRAAVQSANGVWVATLPATATSGRTANGLRVMADGIDENGAAVTGYILGVADFAVASLDVTPAPEPGGVAYAIRYFDALPDPAKKGDVTKIDGVLKFYDGEAWEAFATPPPLDDAVTRTSTNGVKSSGIWSMIWGALSALPTGFSSLHDWCVSQLAGKADKADLPYALAAAEKSNGAYALRDRTVSCHTLDTEPGIDFSGTPSISGYIQQDGQGGFFPITSTEVIDFNEARCTIKANYDGGYVYVEAPPPASGHSRAFEVSGTDDYMQVVAEWDVTGDSHSPFWGSGTTYPSMSSVELQCSNGMNVFIPVKWGEATVPLSFPAATSGKSRDFYFALNVPSGATAPTVTAPGGVTLLDEFGAAFSFATASGWNVWHFTEFSPGLFRVESCGGASAIKAALDGKQATLSSAQLAAIAAVPDKADKAELPYDLGTAIVIDTASSETVEGETVNYGAATLANRTANIVQVTAATALDELRVAFPAATSGKVRDFGLRVEVGTGSAALTAPALVPVAQSGETITLENSDGAIPALADGTATAKGVTLLYFSETAPGVFVVKGEQVEEVA